MSRELTPRNPVALIWIAAFAAVPAQAYVDPGSGHLILQTLGVAFFGLLFYIKQILAFFKGLFVKTRENKKAA